MSASSFQTGFFSRFACRSHTALTIAAIEMWMTPFSGPSHRSWLSDDSSRQNAAGCAMMSSSVRPTTSGRKARIAATHTSLPRPIVNVNPCPSRSPSVFRITYAAE